MFGALYGAYEVAKTGYDSLSPGTKSWIASGLTSAGHYVERKMGIPELNGMSPGMPAEVTMKQTDFVMSDDIASPQKKQEVITETWDCKFTWDNKSYNTATFCFKNDGTIVIEKNGEDNLEGKWVYFGKVRVISIVLATHETFTGTIAPGDNHMSGILTCIINQWFYAGTWSGTKKSAQV
ncbi:MAG: hypothetical protein GY940_12075 [bacterium]|nr:hypothetical protein [bacterium]